MIATEQDKKLTEISYDESYKASLPNFFFEVFALAVERVDGKFTLGDHLVEWTSRLQAYDQTATVSARYHLKTTTALCKLAWEMYKMSGRYTEWWFFSNTEDMAVYHMKRLKRYIDALPEYFGDFKPLTDAESILHYSHKGCEFRCEPKGMSKFKRGAHPYGLICDDILADPEVKLSIDQLQKIELIFIEQLMQMPTHEIHVFGTPQDENDLFTRLEGMRTFNCKRYPASIEQPLWPEEWPATRLKQKFDEIRERAFNKEFLCRPARSEEGYFIGSEINAVTKNRLKNYGYIKLPRIDKYCYGGLDIGKKRHPSHLSVFAENRRGGLVQVCSIWLDGRDYTEQLEVCQRICAEIPMQRLLYDNTRAEMEGFNERGELPAQMEGVIFTQKKKFEMAAKLEKEVKGKTINLVNDERQTRQILNVDNDLKSAETNEGHGDAFWSNALAVEAARAGIPNIRII